MRHAELSYAAPDDPPLKRHVIHAVETVSGRGRLLPVYETWRALAAEQPERMMRALLDLLDVRLDIRGPHWPPALRPGMPLVLYANHPFGIGDGVALLAMAETTGRPWRVFIDRNLTKVPEIRPYALPIDFSESRAATLKNLSSRRRARTFLSGDHIVAVFPAGAVATARWPFGRAEELPWKNFTARLVQQSRAAVLPVFFEGQNGPMFHAASMVSETLRLSLLVSEFIRQFRHRVLVVHPGPVLDFDALRHADNGRRLTAELRGHVATLARQAGFRLDRT